MDVVVSVEGLRWLGFGWNNGELLVVAGILVVAAIASARWLRWD